MIEALAAFIAALVWAAWAAATSGAPAPSAGVAVFGCAALSLLPIAFAYRHARPLGDGAESALLGVAIAAFPLCVFGSLLFSKTHHRALGGVTFAVVAAGVVVAAAVLTRRVRTSTASRGALRFAVPSLAAVSLLGALTWLLGAISATAPASRMALRDAAVGAVLALVTVFVPVQRVPEPARRLLGRVAIVGYVLTAGGLVLFALDGELRRHLAESVPVATFVANLML